MKSKKDEKKVTLREHYTGLRADEKTKFEIEVAQRCIKSLATVRQWAYGCRNPSALCKKIISEYLKMSITDLFPEVVNEKAG